MLLNAGDYGDVIITTTYKGQVIHNMAGIQMSEEQTADIMENHANKTKPSLCVSPGDIVQTDKGLAMAVECDYNYGVHEIRVVRLNRSRKTFTTRWVNQDVPFVRPTFDSEKMRSGLLLDRINFALQVLPFGLPTKKLKLVNRLGEQYLRESILDIGENRQHMLTALHVFISANLTPADRCTIMDNRVYFTTHGHRFYTDGLSIHVDTTYAGNTKPTLQERKPDADYVVPWDSPLHMLTNAILGRLYVPCIGLKSIIEVVTKNKGD